MINCFIRFSTYEAKRLPARFRSIFRLENNTAQGTINRTPNGTIRLDYNLYFLRTFIELQGKNDTDIQAIGFEIESERDYEDDGDE